MNGKSNAKSPRKSSRQSKREKAAPEPFLPRVVAEGSTLLVTPHPTTEHPDHQDALPLYPADPLSPSYQNEQERIFQEQLNTHMQGNNVYGFEEQSHFDLPFPTVTPNALSSCGDMKNGASVRLGEYDGPEQYTATEQCPGHNQPNSEYTQQEGYSETGEYQFAALDDDKRQRRLIRNREAARRNRQKKKEWVHCLQEASTKAKARNEELRGKVTALEEELASLQNTLTSQGYINIPFPSMV